MGAEVADACITWRNGFKRAGASNSWISKVFLVSKLYSNMCVL